MTVEEKIWDFCKNSFANNGSFAFTKNSNLANVCNAPELPGVYLIYAVKDKLEQIVYIGKAGSMETDGIFKDQKLRGRINNKQKGMKRQKFFSYKLYEEQLDKLIIKWCITYNEKSNKLPGFVEGQLLQLYFEETGKLPRWNEAF